MSNRSVRTGLAEVTEQAYSRRHGIEEQSSCWRIRPRVVVMTVACLVIASLIAYWFVKSILENYNKKSMERLSAEFDKGRFNEAYEKLSTDIVPLEYTLNILPIMEEGNFTTIGDVQIHLSCKIPTRHFRLHSHGLDLRNISLKEYYTSKSFNLINRFFPSGEDFIDIVSREILLPSETYLLRIHFYGDLSSSPEGLFRSNYKDDRTNETRWITVSNFSPIFARRAFPCFDEPWIKTPFRISIGRKFNMRSHSNAERLIVEEVYGMSGYVWDRYKKTVPMPTYLVALMVTDFSGYSITTMDRPSHTIYSRKEVQQSTAYVASIIPKLLRLMQNLTGFYYELDKLDVIFVPQLSYSAMENWGLITFREDFVLLNDETSVAEPKMISAYIVAHEVAHQWFGNLVTPKWWSDVWLKEGFASFLAYVTVNALNRNWTKDEWYCYECHEMLTYDASAISHPLHITLNTTNQITNIFDKTSYLKGNCLTNMIYHFLGKATFLSAIRRYLRTYSYRSADQFDLWETFQEEINLRNSLPKDLAMKEIMITWTDQPGFPLVEVKRDRTTGTVLLSQRRFFKNGLKDDPSLWIIPLTWTTGNSSNFHDTTAKCWLSGRTMELNDPDLNRAVLGNQWIFFNINRAGLYRVNYDDGNWNLLTNSFGELSPVSRAKLLSDATELAEANVLNYTIFWSILGKLEHETDRIVWRIAVKILKPIEEKLQGVTLFKHAMCKLLGKVYEVVADIPESRQQDLQTQFRDDMLTLSCSMNHRACVRKAREVVLQWLHEEPSNRVPLLLRSWALCPFAKTADNSEWQMLLDIFKEQRDKQSTLYSEAGTIAFALGCHRNATILKSFLQMVFQEYKSYLIPVLSSIASNQNGLEVAKDFLEGHLEEILSSVNSYNTLQAVASAWSTKESLNWFVRLKRLRAVQDESLDRVIHQVERNVDWTNKYKDQIFQSLRRIAGITSDKPETIGERRSRKSI
ncbi:endoplasmic reticulum aminopeptidase 2 [Orussus abietinus]|uniref:endoplasmic reticulum aminopeptidase 2 n=1 Tax=Orussus abietinus TaxID=222816 RepID=UPI0006269FBB|nr:endoplasmic reticulum aminopeptidase 2 [Orussus abietinus]